MKQHQISGIITPLVTPLTGKLTLDKEALGQLVDHVIEGGVSGILLLGTTGESPSLTPDIRKQVIETGVKLISNRLPVFVNITDPSFLESITLAAIAKEAGADYVMLAPPFYFEMNQQELIRYYSRIADRIHLPVLLYNVPQYAKSALDPESVKELASHEKIVGIKDSSENLEYLKALVQLNEEDRFRILVGSELLFAESLLLGCHGGVHGGSNLYPRLYSSFFRSGIEGDAEQMERYQSLIEKIDQNLYSVVDSSMNTIIGIKYLLSLMGICEAHLAMPVVEELTDKQKNTLRELHGEITSLGY